MKIRLKELRTERCLSQTELAKKIETTQRNLSNWENGINEPDFETLIRIADVFQVTTDYLLGLEPTVDFSAQNISPVDRKIIDKLKDLSDEKKAAVLTLISE